MTVAKVFRPAAFVDLAKEIKRFGALLEMEAEVQFGPEMVAQAVRQRVCVRRTTPLGEVLSLLHLGRKLVGLTGAFTPTDDALMNAVCLRDIALRLEHAGYVIDLESRKRSLVFEGPQGQVLVLAQHNGYALAALRRLHKALVTSGLFQQIQLFTYQPLEEVEALRRGLYTPPRGKTLIDPAQLPIFILPLPQNRRKSQALPKGVISRPV